jgi:hypothetical protein
MGYFFGKEENEVFEKPTSNASKKTQNLSRAGGDAASPGHKPP